MKAKRITALLLAALMIGTLLIGCAKTEGESTKGDIGDKTAKNETKNNDNSTTLKETEDINSLLISKKPLELTIFESLKKPFDSNYAIYVEIAGITNISLKGILSESSSDRLQAYSLMVASGELADIVSHEREKIQEHALEGAYEPLDDLIKEHAPNITAFFKSRPDIKKHATAPDGKIYHIPFIPDGDAAEGWFIRADWLKKLNLEVPTTIDGYYNALKAFREQDPNGNGEPDEIPFFKRGTSAKVLADLSLLWGAHEEWFVKDGVVGYGPAQPEFATAYANIAKWYEEGLIDPEIFTRGGKARDIALGNNLGGATHDWFGSTSTYNDKLAETIPGFEFIPIAPPRNVYGEIVERTKRNQLHWGGWSISSSNEHPVETIKYFDFFFTEIGRRYMNFGIEGETYTMVDGKPVLTDIILNGDKSPVLMLREYGCQMAVGYHQDFEYERQWMTPTALAGVESYMEGKYFMDPFPALPYTPEEKDKYSKLYTAIDTLRDETVQKWVLGAELPKNEFNKFIQKMNNMGLEEVIEIQQAAYDRYIN